MSVPVPHRSPSRPAIALVVPLLLALAVPALADPPQAPATCSAVEISGDEHGAIVCLWMDRMVEVRRRPAPRGAMVFEFPELRYRGAARKEKLDSLLVYSVNVRPMARMLRIVINRKTFLPDKAVRFWAGYMEGARPCYAIYWENRLSEVFPKKEGSFVVAVDPGHGGLDPGNVSGDLYEKTVTMPVARRLEAALDAMPGVEAHLTRHDDVYVPLEDRPRIARLYGADLMISVHCNAFQGSEKVGGFEVFRLSTKGFGQLVPKLKPDQVETAKAVMIRGFQAAHALRDALHRSIDLRDRGVTADELMVTKALDFPSVLVEMGFLTNPREKALLTAPDFQEKIARAMAAGVALYRKRLATGWKGPIRPKIASRPRPKPSLAEGEVLVAKGQTLGIIAKAHGVTVEAICKANGIRNPNRIRVGQKLKIPPKPKAAPAPRGTGATDAAASPQSRANQAGMRNSSSGRGGPK